MTDLFAPITKTERQKECIQKWKSFGGRATIVACTGFGFTN